MLEPKETYSSMNLLREYDTDSDPMFTWYTVTTERLGQAQNVHKEPPPPTASCDIDLQKISKRSKNM